MGLEVELPDNANPMFPSLPSAGAPAEALEQATAILDAFTERFNCRDLEGMDALLHFPHVILAGHALIIWEEPGQMPATFFDDLSAAGWAKTVYLEQRVVLASAEKITFFIAYSRNRANGSVISRHDNIWVVTNQDGRWGIKERSY